MKKAIVIGATGLIGKALIKQLSVDSSYDQVLVLARKKLENLPAKFTAVQIDFENVADMRELLKGDVLFSTLGTTLKKAGSKDSQYKIDFGYQFQVARIASENNVKKLVLLSSAGANSKSHIFYSRMKGELDDAVQKLNFENIAVIRPSMLVGKRAEFRLTEKILTPLAYILYVIPFVRKYRPIRDITVAKAMMQAAEVTTGHYQIYELNEVFMLSRSARV